MNGKQPYQLWGETVREIGLLFAAFGPLETILKGDGTAISYFTGFMMGGLGILFIARGIEMEKPHKSGETESRL